MQYALSLLLLASPPCDGVPSAELIRSALGDAKIAWLKAATLQRQGQDIILEVHSKLIPAMARRRFPGIDSCETIAQAVAVTLLSLDIALSETPSEAGLPRCVVQLSPTTSSHFLSLAFRSADDMPFESKGAKRVMRLIRWVRGGQWIPDEELNEPPGMRPRLAPGDTAARTIKRPPLLPSADCPERVIVRPHPSPLPPSAPPQSS